MANGAASRKSLSLSKKKDVNKSSQVKKGSKTTKHLTLKKQDIVEDVLCCCDISRVDTAIPCTIAYSRILDHCTAWFRKYNDDTGYVPIASGFSPGFLQCYIVDAIAHYLYLGGAFGDTAPFDMGAFPVPFTLACLIKETFAAKHKDGAVFVPRPTGFNNAVILARTYTPAGTWNMQVIDDLAPLVSGEPVFTTGTALSVTAVRALYPTFVNRIVSYGGVMIEDIPRTCKHFDFFHNQTSIESNIPAAGGMGLAIPDQDAFGIAGVTYYTAVLHPDANMVNIGSYHWIMSFYKDVKMTYRKALVQQGYDPLSFTVHAEPVNLSKLRGLITTFAQYRGIISWSPQDQSEFITALVAFVSQIYCRTPSLLNVCQSNVPSWVNIAWRDMPTLACLGEIGTLPRRVDNTLWFPYFAIGSTNYPNGCALIALIQNNASISSSYDEDFDAFPFTFTFSSTLLVCDQSVPPSTSRINFVPLHLYSEALRVLHGYNQEFLVPMPKPKPLVPHTIGFTKGSNTVLLGTMTLVLPAPSSYSCHTICSRKDCAILPGLGLFTRAVVGKYAGFSNDSSGEYWIRLIRASAVVTANVVAAGQGGNAPQTTLTRMFYNQLIGDMTGRPGYMPSRNAIQAANLWRAEGNPVPTITENGLMNLISSPHFANTVAAGIAGATYLYGGVNALLGGRRGFDVLF